MNGFFLSFETESVLEWQCQPEWILAELTRTWNSRDSENFSISWTQNLQQMEQNNGSTVHSTFLGCCSGCNIVFQHFSPCRFPFSDLCLSIVMMSYRNLSHVYCCRIVNMHVLETWENIKKWPSLSGEKTPLTSVESSWCTE